MEFQASPQQQAVFDWISHDKGSAFIEAVAGAGKTTTLIEALVLTKGSVGFAAYNKKIADEIKAKIADRCNPKSENYDKRFVAMGNRVRIGTFHSFGFNAWRRINPKVKVDANGKANQMIQYLGLSGPDALCGDNKLAGLVTKLVSLAKQRAFGVFGSASNRSLWYDMIDHFDLAYEIEDPTQIEYAIEKAVSGLQWSIDVANQIIDFDDMIYMPIVTGCRMWGNDWIFVDEAQDTNPARRALARKMLRHGGRAGFVGDHHQAIYGFTGADSNAVDLIIKEFNCQQLPLTITYRCPKSVVSLAQQYVSHIQAHPNAPEGKVEYMAMSDLDNVTDWNSVGDAILCRNTAPLVQLAYVLIKKGIPCHVEGRDIGVGLLKLVNRFSVRSIDQLFDKLNAYCERETEKLTAKGRETQAEALQDRVATIMVLAEDCPDVDCIRKKIANMFIDSENEVRPTLTLSTVHKAKGREWERVFVLGYNSYMPSPWARQDWQKEQETNLIYVAYTRAQETLILVDG